jgi:hypothetical protein
LLPSLTEGYQFGRPNFELPGASLGIGVSLVKGFSAGCPDFQHEASLLDVEEIDLPLGLRTSHCSNKD